MRFPKATATAPPSLMVSPGTFGIVNRRQSRHLIGEMYFDWIRAVRRFQNHSSISLALKTQLWLARLVSDDSLRCRLAVGNNRSSRAPICHVCGDVFRYSLISSGCRSPTRLYPCLLIRQGSSLARKTDPFSSFKTTHPGKDLPPEL